MRELLGMREMFFYLNKDMGYISVNIWQNSWGLHLTSVHSTVYKLYVSIKNFYCSLGRLGILVQLSYFCLWLIFTLWFFNLKIFCLSHISLIGYSPASSLKTLYLPLPSFLFFRLCLTILSLWIPALVGVSLLIVPYTVLGLFVSMFKDTVSYKISGNTGPEW